jgi:hypothetical protein
VREHVERGTPDAAAPDRRGEGGNIDHAASGVVDEVGPISHLFDLARPDHPLGKARGRDVQAHDVAGGEKLVEAAGRTGVAQRQAGEDVVVDHSHAHRLGQHAHLRADAAVADDAERPAADLVAAGGALVPPARVHLHAAVEHAPVQGDDLGDREFGDGAGVAERRVEDRKPRRAGGPQIHLVGPDAEAADGQQSRASRDDIGPHLRSGTDADGVGLADGLDERWTFERALDAVDAEPLGAEHRLGARVDVLEQHDADAVFGETGLQGGGIQVGGYRRRVGIIAAPAGVRLTPAYRHSGSATHPRDSTADARGLRTAPAPLRSARAW